MSSAQPSGRGSRASSPTPGSATTRSSGATSSPIPAPATSASDRTRVGSVSAAIIGPRTREHLDGQLGAADVVLSDDVLDRIDEIVPPGANLNPADQGWVSPAVASPWRRRRPVTD